MEDLETDVYEVNEGVETHSVVTATILKFGFLCTLMLICLCLA